MALGPRRTYIDTMLFVYQLALRKTDMKNRLSSEFFRAVEGGVYEGVITTFTYAEYIAVMKETLSNRLGVRLSQGQLDSLRHEFESFVDKEGIEVLDADDLSSGLGRCEIFRWSSQVVETTGTVEGADHKWRTIGGADTIHVVLANRAGAELLATFDEGFKVLDDLAALGWSLKALIIPEVLRHE